MNRNCYSIWGHSLKWGKGGGMCEQNVHKVFGKDQMFGIGSEGSATKPALFQFIYAVGNILLMNFFC